MEKKKQLEEWEERVKSWQDSGLSQKAYCEREGIYFPDGNIRLMGGRSITRSMIDIHQVWLVWEPVDMRSGIDRLSGLVQETLGRSPCDGTAYAFRNSLEVMRICPHNFAILVEMKHLCG